MKRIILIVAAALTLASCATVGGSRADKALSEECQKALEKAVMLEWSDAVLKTQCMMQLYKLAEEKGDERLMALYGDQWNAEAWRAQMALAQYIELTR